MRRETSRFQSWLPSSHNMYRYGIVVVVFGVMMMGGLWLVYANIHTPEAEQQVYEEDIVIPERTAMPEIASVVAENNDEIPEEIEEDMPEEIQMPVPVRQPLMEEVDTHPKGLSDVRKKSSIVAPYAVHHDMDERSKKGKHDEDWEGVENANSRFLRSATGKSVTTAVADVVTNLRYKVLQGKMIDAVLEPRAISDLPGMICATVQRDVYGAQGRETLIPWGSRICGQYSTELKKGQGRLFAVWNTLRRPDGVQVTLDSIGADQLGTAGMGGYVDTHFAEMFGVSALLAIIGVGTSQNMPDRYHRGDRSYYYRDSVQQAVAQTAAQTAQRLLAPYADIPPTVVVPAGSRIRIYVNRDLDFSVLANNPNKEQDFVKIP